MIAYYLSNFNFLHFLIHLFRPTSLQNQNKLNHNEWKNLLHFLLLLFKLK